MRENDVDVDFEFVPSRRVHVEFRVDLWDTHTHTHVNGVRTRQRVKQEEHLHDCNVWIRE